MSVREMFFFIFFFFFSTYSSCSRYSISPSHSADVANTEYQNLFARLDLTLSPIFAIQSNYRLIKRRVTDNNNNKNTHNFFDQWIRFICLYKLKHKIEEKNNNNDKQQIDELHRLLLLQSIIVFASLHSKLMKCWIYLFIIRTFWRTQKKKQHVVVDGRWQMEREREKENVGSLI